MPFSQLTDSRLLPTIADLTQASEARAKSALPGHWVSHLDPKKCYCAPTCATDSNFSTFASSPRRSRASGEGRDLEGASKPRPIPVARARRRRDRPRGRGAKNVPSGKNKTHTHYSRKCNSMHASKIIRLFWSYSGTGRGPGEEDGIFYRLLDGMVEGHYQ